MTVKQTIKRIIPIFVLKVLRKGKKRIADRRANYLQTKRFKRWFSRDDSTDKARVETRLAFDIHRLEKGLSHVDFRDGFGKGVLSEISKRMVLLEKADPRFMENPLYLQGLAVLHEYQSRHKNFRKWKVCSPYGFGMLHSSISRERLLMQVLSS